MGGQPRHEIWPCIIISACQDQRPSMKNDNDACGLVGGIQEIVSLRPTTGTH